MTCTRCGVTNTGQARFCGRCGAPLAPMPPPPGPRLEDNTWARITLPIGRSGWAIAAGYMGLLSLAVFPAPLALLLGIVAMRDIAAHPGLLGKGRAIFAIVMGVIFTGVLVVMAVSMLNSTGST